MIRNFHYIDGKGKNQGINGKHGPLFHTCFQDTNLYVFLENISFMLSPELCKSAFWVIDNIQTERRVA